MTKRKSTQKKNGGKKGNPQEQESQNPTNERTLIHQHSMEHPAEKLQEQTSQNPTKGKILTRQRSVEDPAEKLQNLKDLNSILLKETLERRQQVESLVHDKEALEAELSRRIGVEKNESVAELNRESEKNVRLEIEGKLFCVFIMSQMREMCVGFGKEKIERENEIKGWKREVNVLKDSLENERERSTWACRERDIMKSDLDSQVTESTRLVSRLNEMEGKERQLKGEILQLKDERERLLKEKKVRDGDIEALKKEKGLLERISVETGKEMDALKLENEEVIRGKKEIEMQKSKQNVKINELENNVGNLNGIVLALQKKEKDLDKKITEVEKSYSEALEEKEGMTLQINALVCREEEKQRTVVKVMEENEEISKLYKNVLMDLNDKKGQIEKLVRQKNDIEERNVSQESEILLLHKEIAELKNAVYSVKESCSDQVNGLTDCLENAREKCSQACRERDLMKSDLDSQVKESTRLVLRLTEMEGKERDLKDEILLLKDEFERKSIEMGNEIHALKMEIEEALRKKKEFEMLKSEQSVKIDELEKEVGNLNEIVSDLRKKEKVLHEKNIELGKSYGEALEKKEGMTLQINALVCQEEEKQRIVEKLMEEKEEISELYEKVLLDLNDRKGLIEKLLQEKNDIEEREISQGNEIIELHKEIGELRGSVFSLKESCKGQEEKNKQLVNEVRDCKIALDRAIREKDNAQKDFDIERNNVIDLSLKVSKMEKRIEESVEKLAKISSERENLVEERKKMESHIGLLMEEKELVQKSLLEAKQNADDLRAKVESISSNSNQALSMLKSTAAMVCQSKNDNDGKRDLVIEKKLQDETEQYVAELEAIKIAFMNQKKWMEDMKQEVEVMKNSVAEAHKKKSFWTLVSSATTLFAAASVAFAAKAR